MAAVDDDAIRRRRRGIFDSAVGLGRRYSGQFTLSGVAGVEAGNSKTFRTRIVSSAQFVETAVFDTYNVQTRFWDKVNLSYYVTEDLKTYVGHRYLGGKHALALGGEWAFG